MELVVDPVCGMKVDPSKVRFKTVYRGKIYYFCSARCKKVFEENPEHYLVQGPKGMPSNG
ncbi:MAG: YHS domain-containing protein [Ignisphaera sp.]